jgi:hypothetical protein
MGSDRRVTIVGSDNVVTREVEIAGFDQVEVSNAFQVQIRRGESFRVAVRVDEELEEYLRIVKEGDTLKIGLQRGRSYHVRNAVQEAEVTMPELSRLALSGASAATVTGFRSSKALVLSLSGSSALQGDVEAGDIRVHLSGASNVILSGSAGDMTLSASGESLVGLADFEVEDADVKASGASTITVHPSGRLDVRASGASQVYYVGSPVLGEVHKSGASSVEHK